MRGGGEKRRREEGKRMGEARGDGELGGKERRGEGWEGGKKGWEERELCERCTERCERGFPTLFLSLSLSLLSPSLSCR